MRGISLTRFPFSYVALTEIFPESMLRILQASFPTPTPYPLSPTIASVPPHHPLDSLARPRQPPKEIAMSGRKAEEATSRSLFLWLSLPKVAAGSAPCGRERVQG